MLLLCWVVISTNFDEGEVGITFLFEIFMLLKFSADQSSFVVYNLRVLEFISLLDDETGLL